MSTPSSARLQNKVVVITGSSSGLGRAISFLFAASGASLIVCADITPKPSGLVDDEKTLTHEDINSRYGKDRARYVSCDVGSSADVSNAIRCAVQWGGRLDVYVLCIAFVNHLPSSKLTIDA